MLNLNKKAGPSKNSARKERRKKKMALQSFANAKNHPPLTFNKIWVPQKMFQKRLGVCSQLIFEEYFQILSNKTKVFVYSSKF